MTTTKTRKSLGTLLTPLAVLIALLFPPAEVSAKDLVKFTNGRSVTGRVVEETADSVTIELFSGATMTVPRSMVAEIVRDIDKEPGEAETPVAGVLRSEHFFLWSGDRRLGSRLLYVRRLDDGGLLLEEDSVFTDPSGAEDARIRLVEKVGPNLEPREIVYRETSKGGVLLLRGQVRGTALTLTASYPGSRKSSTLEMPSGHRFPLSAREFALQNPERIRSGLEIPVFDPREEGFFTYRFESGGKRRVDWEGAAVEVDVVRRSRGERATEEIWIDPGGRCLTEELNGTAVVAVLSTRERVEAYRAGGTVGPSREEERVRPVVLAPEAGFSLRKPTISWSEEAVEKGGRKALSLANLRYFAYVDVFVFPGAPEGGSLSELAKEMEHRFSDASRDFRKVSEGFRELGRERAYQMVATSRNKGEDLRSLVVGALHESKRYYVTMACPEKYFAKAREEFEAILESFTFLD